MEKFVISVILIKIKECVKVSNDKNTIYINHIECTICNKIISKTNWSKYEKN